MHIFSTNTPVWLRYRLPHQVIGFYSGAMHIFRTNAPVISGHVADAPSLVVALPTTPLHIYHVRSTLPGTGEDQRSQYQMGATPLIVASLQSCSDADLFFTNLMQLGGY